MIRLGPLPKALVAAASGMPIYTVVREEDWQFWAIIPSWVFAVGASEVGVVLGRLLGPEVAVRAEIGGGIVGEWLGERVWYRLAEWLLGGCHPLNVGREWGQLIGRMQAR